MFVWKQTKGKITRFRQTIFYSSRERETPCGFEREPNSLLFYKGKIVLFNKLVAKQSTTTDKEEIKVTSTDNKYL